MTFARPILPPNIVADAYALLIQITAIRNGNLIGGGGKKGCPWDDLTGPNLANRDQRCVASLHSPAQPSLAHTARSDGFGSRFDATVRRGRSGRPDFDDRRRLDGGRRLDQGVGLPRGAAVASAEIANPSGDAVRQGKNLTSLALPCAAAPFVGEIFTNR